MQRAASIVAVLLLAACAAKPAPVAPPQSRSTAAPAPEPSVPLVGEMAQLQWYVGDWACTGHDPESGEWKAVVHVRTDAGGHLLSVHMVGPDDNLTVEIKGRNEQSGMWFHIWADREGAWGSMAAQFWEGDTVTMVDDANDQHRSIFTKLSDTKYTHADERLVNGRDWVLQWEKSCEKISGS